MCKRYSFTLPKEMIENQLGFEIVGNLRTSFNIAPMQFSYVITNTEKDRLQYMTWGLIPHWSKDGNNNGKLINARKEGISASTSFRIPIRRRRCLVLADSYYQWQKEGLNEVPHRIVQDGAKIMMMAGVWDIWEEGSREKKSFSIITIPSTPELNPIGDRCPLVLETQELQDKWLSDIDLDAILKVMGNRPTKLKHYPISKKVNSIKFNSVELHEELAS